ncbi:MAG: MFS transporter [Fidelibacterota bacterium]
MNKKIFIAACLGMLLFGMAMLSLGSANTFLTEEHHLSKITIASLAALLPLGILIGSLIFGPVVDRYGYKLILIICSLFISFSFLLISIATELFWLRASFFLIGFGGGAINGSTNALVADISEDEKSANLSLLGVFYGIGALGMPFIIGALSNFFTNQHIIQFFATIVLLPIIYFWIIKFPEPKQTQGVPITAGLRLFKDPVILLMGFFLFFESGIEGISNNWATIYLTDTGEISADNALFALSTMIFALTATRLLLGKILKQFPAHIVLFVCLIIAFAGSLVLLSFSNLAASFVGMVLLGIGFAAGFPVILGYVGELYSELSGTAFSIAFVIALTGNTVINYLVGIISNTIGIIYFPAVLIGSILIMTVLLAAIRRKIKTEN